MSLTTLEIQSTIHELRKNWESLQKHTKAGSDGIKYHALKPLLELLGDTLTQVGNQLTELGQLLLSSQ